MKKTTAALALAMLAACSKPGGATGAATKAVETPVAVTTADVDVRAMPKYLMLTGSVLADRQSEVAANVAGRVLATLVERGQAVTVGQPLVIIDSKAAAFSSAAAAAQAQAAQSQVTLAQTECERADQLFKEGAIAKAEYDRLKTSCSAQLFSATAARANADLAAKLAGDTVIRAPFDGIVGERYVNMGEYVTPQAKVVSMFSVDPVRVSISVPEPAVGQVKVGQTLGVKVSAYPDRVFPAEVRFVSPALRPNTRDLIIEAVAKNKEGALRPGMFCTIQLSVGEDEFPTVPVEAIKQEGLTKRLFLAKDGHAFEMVVQTGTSKEGRVSVLDSIEKGQKVIVKPPPELKDGTPLTQSAAL